MAESVTPDFRIRFSGKSNVSGMLGGDTIRSQASYEARREILIEEKVQEAGIRLKASCLVGRPGGRFMAA